MRRIFAAIALAVALLLLPFGRLHAETKDELKDPALAAALDLKTGSGATHFESPKPVPEALVKKLVAARNDSKLGELTAEDLAPIKAHAEQVLAKMNANVSDAEGPLKVTNVRIAFSDNAWQLWHPLNTKRGTLGRGTFYATPRYKHVDSGGGWLSALSTLDTHEGVYGTGYDATGRVKTILSALSGIGGTKLMSWLGGGIYLRRPKLTWGKGGQTVVLSATPRATKANQQRGLLGRMSPTVHQAPSTNKTRVFVVVSMSPVNKSVLPRNRVLGAVKDARRSLLRRRRAH